MRSIAPTATIDPRAELPNEIEIGPGCYIGPGVRLGEGCRLLPNVTILGRTTIGCRNLFYSSAVIGAAPQDLKHAGEDTQLLIGDDNTFRECVTVHTGTALGGGVTRIGNNNQFQVASHVAHDAAVGDHCVLSNCVQLAGHVHVEDHVTISGLAGVHQFVTIGKYAFVVGLARCVTDVPPFLIYSHDGTVMGVNARGLARWGFRDEQTDRLKRLYRQLFPRRGKEEESNGSLRNLYEMLFSRRARRSARSLSRRIKDAETNDQLDDNCRYMLEFLKRSLHNGVFGRYLESERRDGGLPPPAFFRETPSTEEVTT